MDEKWLRQVGEAVRTDVLPALALGAIMILVSDKAAERQVATRSFDAAAYALIAMAAATVPLRRHAPMAMLGISSAVVGTYLGVGYPHGLIVLVVAIAAYAVAVSHTLRHVVPVVLPAAILISLLSDLGHQRLIIGAGGDWLDWLTMVAWSGPVVVPAIIGVLIQRSRVDAERAKDEASQRQAEQERLRISREVHDIVDHSLSIISLQAGVALHVLDRRPEQAQITLETIRRTSLDALEELRAAPMLPRTGVRLDDRDARDAADTASTRPARFGSGLAAMPVHRPACTNSSKNRKNNENNDILSVSGSTVPVPLTGLARLDGLLGEVRLCGVPVEFMTTGAPQALPADVELAAFRVIQESLNNVMRHAAPARASVHLGYEPDRIIVEVVDEPLAPRPPSHGTGRRPGLGLTGLAERLGELGGTLTAGPQAALCDTKCNKYITLRGEVATIGALIGKNSNSLTTISKIITAVDTISDYNVTSERGRKGEGGASSEDGATSDTDERNTCVARDTVGNPSMLNHGDGKGYGGATSDGATGDTADNGSAPGQGNALGDTGCNSDATHDDDAAGDADSNAHATHDDDAAGDTDGNGGVTGDNGGNGSPLGEGYACGDADDNAHSALDDSVAVDIEGNGVAGWRVRAELPLRRVSV